MGLIRMGKFVRKLRPLLPAIAVLAIVVIAVPNGAHAGILDDIKNGVIGAIAALVTAVINLFGKITIQLIHILIRVASYNGFLDSPAVTIGWVVVRDVANMFFVALLLVISIGTIVNPDRFGGVRQVMRVLLYALFVNFSRTIAGIFIDISQVVMLTFVNGFAAAAGGNFAAAFGITQITDIARDPGVDASFLSLLGGMVLSAFMFIVFTVIIGIMVVALVMRMVTLWFLVVISPLAFALGASDFTKSRYAEWWKRFSAELTTGPVVAFFLWLSLVVVQNHPTGADLAGPGALERKTASGAEDVKINCGTTEFCEEDNVVRFIIAATMMLAGLMFAKEFSGVGGELAGAAWGKGKGYVKTASLWAAKRAAIPAALIATGGIPLAAGAAVVTSQKFRLAAGKAMADTGVLGVRGIGLRVQAGARRSQEADEKKAMETMRYATADQRRTIAFSKTATEASRRIARVGIASDKVAMQKIADDIYKKNPLMSDQEKADEKFKRLKELYDGLGDEAKFGNKDAIESLGKVEGYDPRVMTDLKKRETAIKNMSTSDFLKMDANALVPEVVGMMTDEQREKLYKGGKQDHRDKLDVWYQQQKPTDIIDLVNKGRRKLDDLTIPELKMPEIAVKVLQEKPGKARDEVFLDPGRRDAIRDASERMLGARKPGAVYDSTLQSAAEGLAMTTGDIGKAFNVDASNAFKGAEDQRAFETAFTGTNDVNVALSVKSNQVIDAAGNVTAVGASMAKMIDSAGLHEMLKAAKTAPQRETVKAIVNAIVEVGTRPGAPNALHNKAKKVNDDYMLNGLIS